MGDKLQKRNKYKLCVWNVNQFSYSNTQEIDLLDEYSLSSYLVMAYVFHSKTTRNRASKVYMCLECLLFFSMCGGSLFFSFHPIALSLK